MRPIPPIRAAAFVLGISGIYFAGVAWIIPIFWPGYLVWAGWLAIAAGSSKINNPFFWGLSFGWNLLITGMLLSDTDWTFQNKSLGYLHARLHSVAACAISFVAMLYFAKLYFDTPLAAERGSQDGAK